MKGRRVSPAGSPPSDSAPSDSDLAMGNPSAAVAAADSNKEQDRYLPIANVGRIMKRSLPANAKISKEAKEAVQECVSEFISFVTGEASDRCQREKRKTINGDDLLWAMTTLGFDNYVGPLKAHLNSYRDDQPSAADGVRNSHSVPAPAPPGTAHTDPMTGAVAGSVSGFNGGFYPVPPQGFGGGTAACDVRMVSKMGGVHGLQW